MKKFIATLTLVILCSPAAAGPTYGPKNGLKYDRSTFKKLVKEVRSQGTLEPKLDFELFKIGQIGFMPTRVVRISAKGGLNHANLEFKVLEVVDAENLLVQEITLERTFWISGIPTATLVDNALLSNTHPLMSGVIFLIADNKSYNSRSGKRTVSHITVCPELDEVYKQYKRDIWRANGIASREYNLSVREAKEAREEDIQRGKKSIRGKFRVIKKLLKEVKNQKTSAPVLNSSLSKIGQVGFMPAMVIRVDVDSKERSFGSLEFKVQLIADSKNLIVKENTLKRLFWLSGIPTHTLKKGTLLTNLHPLISGKYQTSQENSISRV